MSKQNDLRAGLDSLLRLTIHGDYGKGDKLNMELLLRDFETFCPDLYEALQADFQRNIDHD